MKRLNLAYEHLADFYLMFAAETASVLGFETSAAGYFRRQLTRRLAYMDENNIKVAQTRFNLANSLIAGDEAARSESEKLLATVRPIFENRCGTSSTSTARIIYRQGLLRELAGDHQAAERLYLQSERMFARCAPSWFLERAYVCDRLAAILSDRGDPQSALYAETARNTRLRFQLYTMRKSRYHRYSRPF